MAAVEPAGDALEGRSAIVTGAGRGVGRGIALALASAGARVAVVDRVEDTLGDTCAEIERRGGTSIPIACDVRDLGAIERAVDDVVSAFGGIRILVNNAQMITDAMLLDIREDAVNDMWSSGPLAAFRLMRACHPYLRDGGAIVNISSSAANSAGPPGFAVYAAVKAALQTFSRAAAVNTIQPRVVTPAFEKWQLDHPDEAAASIRMIPVGRLADAEQDVGRAVVFLAGPDAAMITGAILPVDGGSSYLR
jgi:NAD(P)-dependent dehydrogenase (short-subunit alcohol dehydrogenase family)